MVRVVAVPEPIAAALTAQKGSGLSEDPGADLLALENVMRVHAANLLALLHRAGKAIADAQDDLAAVATARGWTARRERVKLAARVEETAAEHKAATEVLDTAQQRIHDIRAFIIGLDLADGPLARAGAGWDRRTERPAWVVPFAGEAEFLAVNAQRGERADWGEAVIAGEPFGQSWRRDPDDILDATVPSGQSGRWLVGYIMRTGEVYALLRYAGDAEQLWLLGRGFDDTIRWTLRSLEKRMDEPNSLLLLADVVHTFPVTDGAVPPARSDFSRRPA